MSARAVGRTYAVQSATSSPTHDVTLALGPKAATPTPTLARSAVAVAVAVTVAKAKARADPCGGQGREETISAGDRVVHGDGRTAVVRQVRHLIIYLG